MQTVGAIVLAAGGSSRLGRSKQFLLHHGRTLLEHAVDAATGCSPIVVVAGRDFLRVQELLRDRPVTIVHHAQWDRGIGSSIRVGLHRLLEISPHIDAVIILLCDQPHVTFTLVSALRAKWLAEQKPIVACRYAGGLGVPVLFSRPVFPELLSLDDHSGAKQIIEQRSDVPSILFPEGSIDIDTTVDMESHLEPQPGSGTWAMPEITED